jgi:hypothetical protein
MLVQRKREKMSTENNKISGDKIVSIFLIIVISIMILCSVYCLGHSHGKRQIRCDVTCDILNSKVVACESGVTVCSNNKIIWRKNYLP